MSENQVITNMENEVEEMTAIHYLNQDNAVFERTEGDRKSTRLNSSHRSQSRMPSSA